MKLGKPGLATWLIVAALALWSLIIQLRLDSLLSPGAPIYVLEPSTGRVWVLDEVINLSVDKKSTWRFAFEGEGQWRVPDNLAHPLGKLHQSDSWCERLVPDQIACVEFDELDTSDLQFLHYQHLGPSDQPVFPGFKDLVDLVQRRTAKHAADGPLVFHARATLVNQPEGHNKRAHLVPVEHVVVFQKQASFVFERAVGLRVSEADI
ncbi:hypothetical protein [Inhella crocodyli]|uniref:Uncharacterized protein n=1 Tax=Inhella crocodyli TaxID=2499851 RepID=A0A3S2XWV5_9BURK|nr:hypothetical protein [Inhella crocodyli]RVT88343.1 hypothetical protein EOD73_04990 [Inhella crocodyli]